MTTHGNSLPDPDQYGMVPRQPEEQEAPRPTDMPSSEFLKKDAGIWEIQDSLTTSDNMSMAETNTYGRHEVSEDFQRIFDSIKDNAIHDFSRHYMESYHEPRYDRLSSFQFMPVAGFVGYLGMCEPCDEEPPKPVEKPDPYPSRAGWRADYLLPHDPFADESIDKPRGKIGEFDIVQSDTTFADVGGNAKAKELLMEIAAQYEQPDLYEKWDVPVPKGVLLYGEPGTGKTLLAKAFAGEAGAAFVEVPAASIRDKFYGESEKKLKNLFDEAAKFDGNVVLFFDELDSLLPDRRYGMGGGPDGDIVNTFLQSMDGMQSAPNVMALGATNYPQRLDAAAIRPGRFDQKVEVEFPDIDGCIDITAKQLLKSERGAKRVLVEDAIDFGQIGELSEGLSGADIAEVLRRVKRTMARTERALGSGSSIEEAPDALSFDQDHRDSMRISTDDITSAIFQYRLDI